MTKNEFYDKYPEGFYCTKETPLTEGNTARPVMHVDACEVADSQESGWPSGDTVSNKCPHCKTRWTEELAQ